MKVNIQTAITEPITVINFCLFVYCNPAFPDIILLCLRNFPLFNYHLISVFPLLPSKLYNC